MVSQGFKSIGSFATKKLRSAVRRLGFIAIVLSVLGYAVGGQAAPSVAVPSAPVSLIYAGWFGNTIPTPVFIRNNKTFLETQPFHGIVAYLRNDSTGANATTGVMSGAAMPAAAFTSILAPLKGAGFTTLTDNFGLVQGSTPPDFFDDWSPVISNFANLAAALKDAGLRGVCFDNEQYFKKWGTYPAGVLYPAKSLAEYRTQARLRGKQVMEAMVQKFPAVAIMTLHGPYVSELTAPESLKFPQWQSANMLLGPFFAGFVEGAGTTGLSVDGGELYNLRSESDFLISADWRKHALPSAGVNCPFIPESLRSVWSGRTSISFGIYDKPFGSASMNASILKTTLINSLRHADHFVWFYVEGPTFLLPASAGGAGAPWVDAVRQAVATASVPIPLAAPQNLVVMPMSPSEIDLSWTSTTAGQTGFKIEWKAGTSGTYVQIALVDSASRSYTDSTLTGDTTYSYRVRATSGASDSAFSNEAIGTTPAGPSPADPDPAAAASSGSGGGSCGLLGIELAAVLALLSAGRRLLRRNPRVQAPPVQSLSDTLGPCNAG